MPTIFSKIIAGEIPCYKVAENEYCFAFLDINPVAWGHVLVVPKQEINYLFDIPDQLLQEMMLFSKKIAHALKQAVPCERIGVSVIGLEVPHAHIHLIPINKLDDMNFAKVRPVFTKEAYVELAEQVQKLIV